MLTCNKPGMFFVWAYLDSLVAGGMMVQCLRISSRNGTSSKSTTETVIYGEKEHS